MFECACSANIAYAQLFLFVYRPMPVNFIQAKGFNCYSRFFKGLSWIVVKSYSQKILKQ